MLFFLGGIGSVSSVKGRRRQLGKVLESLLNQNKRKRKKEGENKELGNKVLHPEAGHALLTDDMQRRVTSSREGTDQREGE